jgi:16S rRNA processing protein RimM
MPVAKAAGIFYSPQMAQIFTDLIWAFCVICAQKTIRSKLMKKDSLIKIGYTMRTHGLKGELTLNLSADAPELSIGDTLMIEQVSLVPYFIENISGSAAKVFVKFEGVNSIEQATALKGCSIFMEKSKRPKLKRGEFYDDELIGFQVIDTLHGNLGTVNQINTQGLNKLLDIGEKSILIPLNGPFVQSISKAKKQIAVELPEGFLEI